MVRNIDVFRDLDAVREIDAVMEMARAGEWVVSGMVAEINRKQL